MREKTKKELDRADIVRDFRLGVPTQPVDATPFDNASPGEVICLAVLAQNLARVVFRLI